MALAQRRGDAREDELGEYARTAEHLVAIREREVADAVAPLRAQARALEQEIESLHEIARQQLWETIVRTRELHLRIADGVTRLGEVHREIRDRTGEVRLTTPPPPFLDFMLEGIRRYI